MNKINKDLKMLKFLNKELDRVETFLFHNNVKELIVFQKKRYEEQSDLLDLLRQYTNKRVL